MYMSKWDASGLLFEVMYVLHVAFYDDPSCYMQVVAVTRNFFNLVYIWLLIQ